MGKSRLADKFGETCPMINFTLGQAHFKCYPPTDGEVRSFLCKEMPEEIKEMIYKSSKREGISSKFISEQSQSKMSARTTPTPQTPTQKKTQKKTVQLAEEDQETTTGKNAEEFAENIAIITWNHTRAAAFLQAGFEVCKFHQLFLY